MSNAMLRLGLLDDEAIALDEAALTLAALDHPDVDITPYAECLSALAMQLLARANGVTAASDRAALLRELLVGEHGFTGDSTDYDDPANADMIAVLDRRRGLPVALSILYVALARKVGWTADALNTPGHVLVRIGQDPAAVIQDPFHDGELLDETGVRRLLGRLLGSDEADLEPEHMTPLSNRSVLVRLLSNQATRARRAGDLSRALELHERMTMIAPSFTGLWWERARLEQLAGRVHAARASLGAMLETTRDPVLCTRIRMALDALARSIN